MNHKRTTKQKDSWEEGEEKEKKEEKEDEEKKEEEKKEKEKEEEERGGGKGIKGRGKEEEKEEGDCITQEHQQWWRRPTGDRDPAWKRKQSNQPETSRTQPT